MSSKQKFFALFSFNVLVLPLMSANWNFRTDAAQLADYPTGVERPSSILTSHSIALPSAVSELQNSFLMSIGDQLKITVFERISNETGRETRSAAAASLVERSELSGSYVVQRNGYMFLPIVGAVRVAGESPSVIEKVLLEKAEPVFGVNLKISLVVTDRQPIYVTGSLPKSGNFAYTPGMIVAQAVALAGGVRPETTETWKQLDFAREDERMRKSAERLKQLIAEADVLQAERTGATAVASARLVALAGDDANLLIQSVQVVRQLEREHLSKRLTSLVRSIKTQQGDLTNLRQRLAQVSDLMLEKMHRQETARVRMKRGVSTEMLANLAGNELVESQSRWSEYKSSIARMELNLFELEHQREKTILDASIEFERRLRTIQDARAQEEATMSTVGQLMLNLQREVPRQRTSQKALQYEILRQTPQGIVQLAAALTMALEPGDILQVQE